MFFLCFHVASLHFFLIVAYKRQTCLGSLQLLSRPSSCPPLPPPPGGALFTLKPRPAASLVCLLKGFVVPKVFLFFLSGVTGLEKDALHLGPVEPVTEVTPVFQLVGQNQFQHVISNNLFNHWLFVFSQNNKAEVHQLLMLLWSVPHPLFLPRSSPSSIFSSSPRLSPPLSS